jgi:hypothetical protein
MQTIARIRATWVSIGGHLPSQATAAPSSMKTARRFNQPAAKRACAGSDEMIRPNSLGTDPGMSRPRVDLLERGERLRPEDAVLLAQRKADRALRQDDRLPRAVKDGTVDEQGPDVVVLDLVEARPAEVPLAVNLCRLGRQDRADLVGRDRTAAPLGERPLGDPELRRPAAVDGVGDEATLALDDLGDDRLLGHRAYPLGVLDRRGYFGRYDGSTVQMLAIRFRK